jgi:DNA-binding response OmpR family regulator
MKKYDILVIEDDRRLSDLYLINFSTERFSVRIAYTGEEGLASVRQKRPDLIILDVILPGMDGWSVLSTLKADAATASIPVIMCTGQADVEDIEKSFKSGAQSYIIKPILFSKLVKKVAAILDIEEILHDKP